MKTSNAVLAAVLSYTLTVTPAFGQNEGSSSETGEEASETDRTEPETPSMSSEETSETANEPERSTKRSKVVEDGPGAPSRGTGKLVAGIVTASVGAGLGTALLIIANANCNDLQKDDANSTDISKQNEREKNIKECKDQQPQAKVAGAVLLAAGLGVGLPLIYFGVQDRKIYNEWKAGQPSQDGNAYAPGKASLVLLPSGDSFSPGINVSYNF